MITSASHCPDRTLVATYYAHVTAGYMAYMHHLEGATCDLICKMQRAAPKTHAAPLVEFTGLFRGKYRVTQLTVQSWWSRASRTAVKFALRHRSYASSRYR